MNNNKNTNKKQHSTNLAIVLTIIGLGVVATGIGVVYATQTINEDLHVTEQDISGYTGIRLENAGQSNMELRTYGDSSSVWTGASIINSWNTDVDLGLVADSLTKVDDGTSDHVIWLDASSGNVGIGTTSPDRKLDVSGDTKIGKTDARHYLLISSSEWPELRFQTPTDNGVMRTGVAHADSSYGVLAGDWYTYSAQTNRMDLIVPKAGGVHLASNGGNVGIGTTSPNSKLEVTNGYFELDTSSGTPPSTDCDNADETGRMKVDESSLTLYVCAYDSSTYAWMIMDGRSSIITDSPIITSIIADDPDDLDDTYSIDDTITVTFDSDTNMPGGIAMQTRSEVVDLFTFTENLGQQYRGQWIMADTFTITIYNVNNTGPPVIGTTTVTPTGTTPILSADETSGASSAESPVLTGDFGIL